MTPRQGRSCEPVNVREGTFFNWPSTELPPPARTGGWEKHRKTLTQLMAPAVPTEVFLSYWEFAVERQRIFFRRARREPGPWTRDSILAEHKFTNAYRAADRVSQFLLRHVQYSGKFSGAELFFRTLLFKLFNRIETWRLITESFPQPSFSSRELRAIERVLDRAIESGRRVYSAAYIMPSGGSRSEFKRKHQMHLWLLEKMIADGLPDRLECSRDLGEAFVLLRAYPTIGDFLAYQFATDLNYSELMNHSEAEFVMPGPGAREGIAKCFSDFGGKDEGWIIRRVTESQDEVLRRLGLDFPRIGNRQLQLIDCQNLFCEVAKYARLRHPEFNVPGGRSRIKQRFEENPEAIEYFFPPKWKILDPVLLPYVAND